MKTLEELYKEVIGSEDLKKEFLEAAKNQQVDEFLKKHDCSATKEEIVQFAKDRQEGELSDEELDMVSGGGCEPEYIVLSVATLGSGCAIVEVTSLTNHKNSMCK